jgi:aminoethylphosphonate catabolism LysR family transcriptional regulator
MKFTQLRTFHALATAGGFTKAAELLNVTQPAVTTQLKTLEHDYGVELFHRRGHDLALTDVGNQLFEISAHIFGLLDEAQEVLTSVSQLRGGQLRLAADSPFFIMDLLASFKSAYPQMTVSVEVGSAAQCLEWLRENQVDVAVMTAVEIPPELHAEPFLRLDLKLLVRSDHRWSKRRSIRLQELAELPMIMRESKSMTREILERCMAHFGLTPEIALQLHSQVAVQEAVAAGLGFGVELDGGRRPDDRLRLLSIKGCTVFGKEYVACHRNRYALRKVRAFLKMAREMAPNVPQPVRIDAKT